MIYQLFRNTFITLSSTADAFSPKLQTQSLGTQLQARWDGAILLSLTGCQPQVRAPGMLWVPALHLPRSSSSWAARLYKLRKEVTQG